MLKDWKCNTRSSHRARWHWCKQYGASLICFFFNIPSLSSQLGIFRKYEQDHYNVSFNFEFDRYVVSGTSARYRRSHWLSKLPKWISKPPPPPPPPPLGKTVLSKYSFIFHKWCVNICNNQAQKLKSNFYVGPVNICPNFSHCYFTPSEFIIQENCDHKWTEKPGNPMWSHFSGRCATLNWLNISRVSIHIRYHQCEKKNM